MFVAAMAIAFASCNGAQQQKTSDEEICKDSCDNTECAKKDSINTMEKDSLNSEAEVITGENSEEAPVAGE